MPSRHPTPTGNNTRVPKKVPRRFSYTSFVTLFPGDVSDLLPRIPDRSVTLVITSPPYNLGKPYEHRVSLEVYLETQARVIAQLHRVLADDGSLCWQVGNYIEKGEVFPLDILFYPVFKAARFFLRNRIIWHYSHGLHASKRFSGRYETLLWFTKTRSYKFNLDPVRVSSKYPGKRHYKGPKKGMPSGNPNGKNPSDVWAIVARDWERELWEIPNVKANHPEKTIQPCQFPIELAERCVLALTNPGDLVLDPYSGVGSALIAAALHDRRSIGAEKESAYYHVALARLEQLRRGSLPIRPLGRPVYSPSPNEKVAKKPEEWSSTMKLGKPWGRR
jgi:adenine-specific DNA-methyltransferase